MFWGGLALWLIETAAFGFNQTAQSGLEHFFDVLAVSVMFIGAVGGLVVSAASEAGRNIRVSVTTVKDVSEEEMRFRDSTKRIIENMLSYKYPEGNMVPDFGCLKEDRPAGMPKEIADHWEMCHCDKHSTHDCGKDGVYPRAVRVPVKNGDAKQKTIINRKKTVAKAKVAIASKK